MVKTWLQKDSQGQNHNGTWNEAQISTHLVLDNELRNHYCLNEYHNYTYSKLNIDIANKRYFDTVYILKWDFNRLKYQTILHKKIISKQRKRKHEK